MGGAERNARTRRQQQVAASRAVAKARGGDQKKIIAVVIGLVLLAGAVIGGVLWTNASKNATAGQTIPVATASQTTSPGVVESRQGVVVDVGKPGAKATIDIYADFLCPICGQFQKQYGPQIEQQINAGTLEVHYHMVPLLNTRSVPEGYSLAAANASLAAANDGKFTAFHDSLFANQPQEGKRGYDNAQLIKLGQDLGITDPNFAQTINAGTYDQQINAAFDQTLKDPNLQQDFGQGPSFGTPTVAVNGKAITLNAGWLDQVIAGNPG